MTIQAQLQEAFAHYQAGRVDAAAATCRSVLQADPAAADAHHLLGIIAFRASQLPEAAAHVQQAIAANSRQAEFRNTLGAIERASGNLDGAIAAFEAALRLRPDHAQAIANLGNALAQAERFADAAAQFRAALKLAPHSPGVLNNLGNVLRELGEIDAAIDSFTAALRLNPKYPEALANMGVALMASERFEEAIAAYRQALGLDPTHMAALVNIGNALLVTGAHQEALDYYAQALAQGADFAALHYNIAALQNYRDEADPAETLRLARTYGSKLTAGAGTPVERAREPERQLRVGLVSGDLRHHAVAGFLLPMLSAHDPAQLSFVAYSTSRVEDTMTVTLRQHIGLWRSLRGVSAEAAARQIREDGVDILIDLSGYTDGARLDVFAQKPAPIQFGWLGYSGTTGLAAMDFVLADRWVAPTDSADQFSEAIWRLPDSYLCFGTPDWPVPAPLPALRNGYVTFGSFNNIGKLGPRTLACWIRVLQAVPESRLVLKSSRGGVQNRLAELEAAFAAAGIAASRLRLIDRLPDKAAHLALYGEIDIGLDPFPYNGTTTTCEALWMGVPVLTRKGDSFVSRVGESLLQTIGLPDWIAADIDDYVSKAQHLAADIAGLAELRDGLRQRFRQSALSDAPRFARNFEAALRQMWRQWCATQAPSSPDA